MHGRSLSCSRLRITESSSDCVKVVQQQHSPQKMQSKPGVACAEQPKMNSLQSSSSFRAKKRESGGGPSSHCFKVDNDWTIQNSGLCGRDSELSLLQQAYERVANNKDTDEVIARGCQELVLIRGHSGTGKSSFATSIANRVKRDSGFFLTGKFELAAPRDPYAVFISAFQQFVEELECDGTSERQGVVHRLQQAVQEATGNEGKLLTDMLPSLEILLGRQTDIFNVNCNEALHRFQFVFSKFCRAISEIAPLVLFLDDLQWSDTSSLDLLMSLVQSRFPINRRSSLLIVCAYRDEGIGTERHTPTNGTVEPESNLSFYLDRFASLSKSGALRLTNVHLRDLDENSTNALVARQLERSFDSTTRLAKVIHCNCHGNPFHTMQLLRLMVSKEDLYQDPEQDNRWCWDENKVEETTTSATTITELFRQKLTCLPPTTLKVLQHAACMGDEIDVLALVTVLDGPTVTEVEAAQHWAAKQGHLAMDDQRGKYRFIHDEMRQSVLAAIENQNDLCFQIGYKLWTRSTPIFFSTKLFIIASLLNHGIDKIADQGERYMAAALNLEAGSKAVSRAAFPDACRYFNAGIGFLEGGDYWKDEYRLALSLFNSAADAALCNQEHAQVTSLTKAVVRNARSLQDALPAHIARINLLGQVGKVVEATKVGLQIVRDFGESLPCNNDKLAAATTRLALRCRSNESLMRTPPMQDEDKLAAMHVLAVILPYSYFAGSDSFTRIVHKLVRMFLKYGMHKAAAMAFVAYGWTQCASDVGEGYRLGSLAFSIIEKTRAYEIMPRMHVPFYAYIYHRTRPLRATLQFLENAEKSAMEIGDIEYAMLALRFKCIYNYWCGTGLPQLESILVEGLRQMTNYKQKNVLAITKPLLQLIHNLTARAPNSKVLSGEVVSEFDPSQTPECISEPHNHFVFGTEVAFIFGDIDLAEQLAEKRRNLKLELFHSYQFKACVFKEALIYVAQARCSSHQRQLIKSARKHLLQLKKWAGLCQENFLDKQLLVEAELWTLKLGKAVNAKTMARYDDSIEAALREGFVQEAALASELCGNYLSRLGNAYKARASSYLHTARDLYLKWGATEKASQLFDFLADESER